MKQLVVAVLLALVASAAAAIGPDPRRDWRSADSAHFRIHFRPEHRAFAQQVAAIAERVYPRITQQLAWQPRGRTEIVLIGEVDLTNGFSTPLPFNTIGIYLAPPDDGELIDNSAWLQLLIAHEFTHIVHLDKVRGAPRVLQWIFGRVPYFFPNVWQPLWAIEGIAVFNEGDAAAGRGRLYGPLWEAWLRAERGRGFKSLAELNADGRALPLSKQYLYGAYFYDYLARAYGRDAVFKYIERYSGNVVPRVHTNPVAATGKTMDVLWAEFLADLTARVDERAALLLRAAETGDALGEAVWSIDALAPAPGGAVYAVIDDGLTRPLLQRIEADGRRHTVARLNPAARIDARGEDVLIAQPEVCDNRQLFYDLYRVTPQRGLTRLTHCARLRRAVWTGENIAALKNDAGNVSAVLLDRAGRELRTLYTPPADAELVDLGAGGDGARIALVVKRAGRWAVLELDVTRPGAAPTTRLTHDAPLAAPRYGADGALTFIAMRDGVYNVWRHARGAATIDRLTHTHTAVLAYAPSDGGLTVAVLVADGAQLRRQAVVEAVVQAPVTRQQIAADEEAPAPEQAALRDERAYLALRSVYPRAWLPAGFADRGLTAFGASTFGADALGWHRYLATLLWEASQREPLGSLEYVLYDRQFFAVTRELKALAWTGAAGDQDITVYERATTAQWVSVLPWLRLQRRIYFGFGAGLDRTERVDVNGPTARAHDARVAAAYVDYDARGAHWLSEGVNRGARARLLYETYQPFGGGFDGAVWRLDVQGFVPLGRSVLAAQLIEARASGTTERFQLGGATTLLPLSVPRLNDRDIALRGYRGDEAQLRGRNARLATLEWRTPIADIDRHAMVPPVGIKRLSAAVFFDVGAAWDSGSSRSYRRGLGAEVLGEVKLAYLLELQLRAGVARGLDDPGTTRAYLAFGRAF